MAPPFHPLTIEQFAERLRAHRFTRTVTAVHMHHTFRPTKAAYEALPPHRKVEIIEGMHRFHTQHNGWSDIAQHVSIAPDGTIWTGRDWNRAPASASGHNSGAFMFEMIGDFDAGRERLVGTQRRAAIEVIALVQLRCGLPASALHFHREFTNQKSCPGTGITKADILAEVVEARRRILARPRVLAGVESPRGGRAFSRYADEPAPFGRGAMDALELPFGASQLAAAELGMERDEEGDPDGVGEELEVGGAPAGPTAFGAQSPRRRALCVGINAYPGNARLNGCVADARLWARQLAALGFDDIELLLDADATREGVVTALRTLLRSSVAGDVLVFQYAGHGTSLPDLDADDDDRTDEAIVPVDFMQAGVLLDDEQFEILDELPDGVALTCFFDSCFSDSVTRFAVADLLRAFGPDGARGAAAPRPRFLEPTPAMIAGHRRRSSGRRHLARRSLRDAEALRHVVFSACRSTEFAFERGGQGLYTARVAPLLAGAAADGASNGDFQRRVLEAFEGESSQHPCMDAPERAVALPFLSGATAGVATSDGTHASRLNGNGSRRAWDALLAPLHALPATELRQLIRRADAMLHAE